nr:MAG TPA: hypothetical protein [Caudoviricetes sp.]
MKYRIFRKTLFFSFLILLRKCQSVWQCPLLVVFVLLLMVS